MNYYSIKVQVRAEVNGLYVTDDIITNNIANGNIAGVEAAIVRALQHYLSKDTLAKISKITENALAKATNENNYKQILEENINGCFFRVYVKREGNTRNART